MTGREAPASLRLYDERVCDLGEGALWHPTRQQLFWFDILNGRLLTVENGAPRDWQFDECVSAAGWVDDTALLIASETRLFRFGLSTGAREDVASLEAGNPNTRSNDGRADPWGGFWIGTMGKAAEPGAGSIYRFYRGELRKLHDGVSIPNATCFAPDRSLAYFTDTPTMVIRRQPLDPATGWPAGPAEPWLDLSEAGLAPDGAVTDADGNVWVAHWGAARVSAYTPDAKPLRSLEVPGLQPSCPAFGGPDLTALFCTSATENLPPEMLREWPKSGMTFVDENVARGREEPQVIL